MVRLISVVACGPGCGNHHENTHNDTWKESGYEQAANGNLAYSAVQNQAHGRWNLATISPDRQLIAAAQPGA